MKRSFSAIGVSGIVRAKPKESEIKRTETMKKIQKKGEKLSSPPIIIKTRYEDILCGGRVFYANENSNSNIAIIYIHGGAYYADFSSFHWTFLKKIINRTNAEVIAPAYRLAPFGTYKNAFDFIVPLYKQYIKHNPKKKIILMGDSAGGGLALALVEQFKRIKISLPDELILISPWVDVAMDNPLIKEYEDKDPFLSVESLRATIKSWQGDLDAYDWHISPIYGDLAEIHNVTTFVGTREIFYPDILELYKKLDSVPSNELIIGEHMNHVYPILPIQEARGAINKIVEVIKR